MNYPVHLVQNLLSCSLLSQNIQIKIYRIIILHVVLYGCETWSLALRDERRLRVFENRDQVTGEWRKVHIEELNDFCSSPNIVRVIRKRRIRWARHVNRMEERRGVYRVVVGKPEGKKTIYRT